jgi:hypothetical protein
MTKHFFFIGILILNLSSCYTFTHYQTGKTVGKGEVNYAVTVNGLGSRIVETLPLLPFRPEFQMSYGITNDLDAVFKYSALAGLHGELKYSFLGNDFDSKFAAALGVNFGGSFLGDSGSDFLKKGGFFNFSIPLHLSYHPTEIFALGLSPNFTALNTYGSVDLEPFVRFGLAPHIEVGKRIRFLLGANALFGTYFFYEYGLGIKWNPG